MNNFNTFNNCLKIISILIFVFIILKYVVVMSSTESIILATIITVTIILIENLLFKNNKRNINVDIPKSCNSCKINIPKKLNDIDDNILVLSENENKSLLLNENFTSVDSVDNDYEYKCYRTKKENFDNLSDNSDISSSLRNNQLITPFQNQSLPQQMDMTSEPEQIDMTSEPEQIDMPYQPQQMDITSEPEQIDMPYQPQQMDMTSEPQQIDMTYQPQQMDMTSESQQIDMTYQPQQMDMTYRPRKINIISKPEQIDMTYQPQQIDIISKPEQIDINYRPEQIDMNYGLSSTQLMNTIAQQPINTIAQQPMMPTAQQTMIPTTQQTMRQTAQQPMRQTAQQSISDRPVYMESQNAKKYIMEDVQNRGGNTYDVDSVQYQQDGIQNEEDDNVLDNNIFRMSVGNRSVVDKFIKSGGKYYGDILTRSTNAPSKFQAASNELKYGDFNYIAPLNKGMINPAYTFVSPTNWYPIPPHPPVCVTNKRCTTSPIIMGDGKDYMNFASLEDFDASRRFTGDMGINIDYIKNVLNNSDGN